MKSELRCGCCSYASPEGVLECNPPQGEVYNCLGELVPVGAREGIEKTYPNPCFIGPLRVEREALRRAVGMAEGREEWRDPRVDLGEAKATLRVSKTSY
jgi:hypothetical protein